MAELHSTRRGVIGAIAALPLLATGASSTAPKRWDVALRDYLDKRRFSDSLDINDPRGDDAVDAYCEAMDHLVEKVPSPDSNALIYKMELARERWEEFSVPDEWLKAFISDVRWLAAH